jgi:hypothetical protein
LQFDLCEGEDEIGDFERVEEKRRISFRSRKILELIIFLKNNIEIESSVRS